MKTLQNRMWAVVMIVTASAFMAGCGSSDDATEGHAAVQSGNDFERGPHGGRLLRDNSFALELTIFEDGVPPEFHVYAYDGDRPLAPAGVQLTVELHRLGGVTDRFAFAPEQDFLKGDGFVAEPHSFDVKVTAIRDGKTSMWTYASYEGRVQISAEAAEAAQLRVEPAGGATIREQLSLTGAIQSDPALLARVRARFPGVIREVRQGLGDAVVAGAVLATVQGNESLQTFSVTAPLKGTVLVRNAVAGEATSDEPMFVVGDLTTLWAELDVFGRDLSRVKPGQAVHIASLDGQTRAQSVVSLMSPVATHSSQSVRARVVLDNAEGLWRPGQFVHGVVTVDESPVPLAVRNSALQRFRDFTVVFARIGDTYEVRMLEMGRSDGEWTEVLGGIAPGEEYVTENSYLIRADIEKSGASHDH